MTIETTFRRGVEWIATNAYKLTDDLQVTAECQTVQMLAVICDVDAVHIAQCVDRHANGLAF